MEGLENIKRRLKKLMALYESAKKVDSEGEAAACAEAIQRSTATTSSVKMLN